MVGWVRASSFGSDQAEQGSLNPSDTSDDRRPLTSSLKSKAPITSIYKDEKIDEEGKKKKSKRITMRNGKLKRLRKFMKRERRKENKNYEEWKKRQSHESDGGCRIW